MTLVPQTPGFPLAHEPRNSPPYSLAFRPPAQGEEPSSNFEKLFAEFLSDLSKREAGEKAAGSARDREVREEAAELRAAEARTRQGREADTPREAGDAPEAEARSTTGDPRETAGSRAGEAAAETVADGSPALPERIARAPEEDSRDSREGPALEAWVPGFQTPYENLIPAEHAGEERAGGTEGRELPPQADLAEASSPRRGADAPAKPSATAKNRAAPNIGAPGNTVNPEKAGVSGGDAPVPQGTPPVPEEGSEVLDSPGDPGPFDREKIRTAGSGEGAEGLRYAITVNHPQDALSQLAASTRQTVKGIETDRPGAGGRETRGTSRRRVDLRDYRERSPREVSPGPGPASTGPLTEKLHPQAPSPDFPAIDPGDPGPRGVGEKAVPPGSNAGTFEETLARELRQNLNSDIVRHAQVILRDKGEGLIRLSLKPESLGNVKIRLELTENKIAGRIIVESGEALRAFEREIASLEQAFRDSGYESAELNAFLSQDGRGSGGGAEERPFYSPRFAADRAASRYDETLERTDTSLSEDSEKGLLPGNRRISVNMLI